MARNRFAACPIAVLKSVPMKTSASTSVPGSGLLSRYGTCTQSTGTETGKASPGEVSARDAFTTTRSALVMTRAGYG